MSKTAKILGIDRKTVRRARDGTLDDLPLKPKLVWKIVNSEFKTLIIKKAKKTGFGYRRLSKYLYRKCGLYISENTVKFLLRILYKYETLLPFKKFQLDTKYILDKESFPIRVYTHIKERGLPVYEWNLVDVATRLRFTAYFYSLNSTYGYLFIPLYILWLRMHNARIDIEIRVNNGFEFCSGSKRKLFEWNQDSCKSGYVKFL